MAGIGHAALNRLEQSLSERKNEYDLPVDPRYSSDDDNDDNNNNKNDGLPLPTNHHPPINKATEDARFPHLCKHTLAGTIKAHTQIYVVNEQIIQAKTTWCTTLHAFDSLHSANTDARTRAVFQHANGDASIVQAQYRNGYGTWTTKLDTPRGRITKSVFVNATVLQRLVGLPVTPHVVDERPRLGDRLVPSGMPGFRRVRQIQAFRSTDSIRAEVERPGGAVRDARWAQRRWVEDGLRQHPAQRNKAVGEVGAIENGTQEERGVRVGTRNVVPKRVSIEDLKEFASLHTLL
ncbi:hypothetical protein PMIN03_005058 [Paraphaeosphaeria minitans]